MIILIPRRSRGIREKLDRGPEGAYDPRGCGARKLPAAPGRGARSALREERRPPCLWDLVSLPLPARARGLRRGRLASALGPRSPARPPAGFPFSPGRRFGRPPRACLFRFGRNGSRDGG